MTPPNKTNSSEQHEHHHSPPLTSHLQEIKEINSSPPPSQQSLLLFNISHHLLNLITSTNSSPLVTTTATEEWDLFNQSCPLPPDPTIATLSVDHPLTSTSISQYLLQILQDTELELECLVIALIYLDRVSLLLPINLLNWKNLLASCTLLASKVYDDFGMSNADFRWIFPEQDLSLVNLLEIRLLHLLNYQVTIPLSIYNSFHSRYLHQIPLQKENPSEQQQQGEEEEQDYELEHLHHSHHQVLQEGSIDEEIDSLMCDSYVLTDSDPHPTSLSSTKIHEKKVESFLLSPTSSPQRRGKGGFMSSFQFHLTSCLKRILFTCGGRGRKRRMSVKESKVHCCDDNH